MSQEIKPEPSHRLWIVYADGNKCNWNSRDRIKRDSQIRSPEVGLKRLMNHVRRHVKANNVVTAIIYDKRIEKEVFKYTYGNVTLNNTRYSPY